MLDFLRKSDHCVPKGPNQGCFVALKSFRSVVVVKTLCCVCVCACVYLHPCLYECVFSSMAFSAKRLMFQHCNSILSADYILPIYRLSVTVCLCVCSQFKHHFSFWTPEPPSGYL